MSKSYFEQRIFGQNTPEVASEQAPETSVGDQPLPAPQQPAPSDAVPSQPYRFGAAARGEHPPIASQAYEDRVQQQEWSAAEELRSRIGMSHRERARLERSLQWEPASDADISPEETPYLGQVNASDAQASDAPYPHGTPQPHITPPQTTEPQQTEPTIGLHAAPTADHHRLNPYTTASDTPNPDHAGPTATGAVASGMAYDDDEDAYTEQPLSETMPAQDHVYSDAPATTDTYGVSTEQVPEAAVTEPRIASATGVRPGARVDLADQRAGTSTVPFLQVRAEDRMGVTSAETASLTQPEARDKSGRNPLALAFLRRKQSGDQHHRRPAPMTAAAALANQQAQLRQTQRTSPFGWLRNGAFALLALFGLGVIMSVSYAGFQRLANPDAGSDIPVISAPTSPIRVTPEQAGLDPDFAQGRVFESDLSIMNQPSGDMALSDDRYAAADQESPTLQLGFGTDTNAPSGATDRFDPVSDIIENAALSSPQMPAPTVPLVPDSNPSAQATTVAVNGAADRAEVTQNSSSLQFLLQDNAIANEASATAAAGSGTVGASITPPEAAVASPGTSSTLDDLTPLANAMNDLPLPALPQLRGEVTVPRQATVIPVQAAPVLQPTPSTTVNILGTETAALSAGSVRGSATTVVAIDPASGQPTTPQAPSLTGAAVVAPFGIQLGALRSEQQADALWQRLTQKFPGLLGSLSHRVVSYDSGPRGLFYRLQAGPMPTKSTAQDFCVQLKRQGQDCIFVRGQS
ncbi:MAG: SPOR domain-containing protein [Alphaproteobacteria bacterium]|nr:SPOR domain-containing protein [Alphaproteobacteria bacterium]